MTSHLTAKPFILAPSRIDTPHKNAFGRLIRRGFANVLVSFALPAILGLSTPAVAQLPQPAPTDHSSPAADFINTYGIWREVKDTEEEIVLAERLVVMEAGISSWPLQASRESVMGQICFALGDAYQLRRQGTRSENLEKAIGAYQLALNTVTRAEAPLDWAKIHNNLGIAFRNRINGTRAGNIEKSIEAFAAALLVFTRGDFPEDWGQTHNNLANAYTDRISGVRADNLELAIASFEAALAVRTQERFPLEWAQTQSNLGVAYRNRIRGARADNLERAITAFRAALKVRTQQNSPQEWALSQNNLANAFVSRIWGRRATNIEQAITAAEAALKVFTRESSPERWGQTQNTLSIAYTLRLQGVGAENIERAIVAAEEALSIFTREEFPKEWADNQYALAMAHAQRALGRRADNLDKALAAFEAALTVLTRGAFPREHLRTARQHGRTLIERSRWEGASVAYESARDAFLTLFGLGLEEAEAQALIAEAGPLFAESAYVALQLNQVNIALELASQGRARLLAVALQLQTLQLMPEQEHRLGVLRKLIRSEERAVEVSKSTERATALERLIALRIELLNLVKIGSAYVGTRGTALSKLSGVLTANVALVVPVVTQVGSKILTVTENHGHQSVSVLDVPELTTDTLDAFMRGPKLRDGSVGGWLGAYAINNIDRSERAKRWPEWLSAIAGMGPALSRLGADRLEEALKKSGIMPGGRLIWLPTGALGILPLGLIQNPASSRRLADDYEIVYAPSVEALAAAHHLVAKANRPSLAAIVNPTGDLPGTAKEAAVVASHFAADSRILLEKNKVTSKAVLLALKGRTHWHFASHGTFSWDDARASALIMHGGKPLTVGQLMEADGLGQPRLVVLSACETGLYDIDRNPDEFVGLPGAFAALGAAGVVGSLWPVDDSATAFLIAKFYEFHMERGLTPPTALSRAQFWLREATGKDLAGFAKNATAHGRLTARHLTEFEIAMSPEGQARSRKREASPIRKSDNTLTKSKDVRTLASSERPYAHPYFWAGFIYTGL